MTSPNGNIFRVTGPLCGEFTGHRWIPLTKASDAGLWWFFYLRLNKRKESWGWWLKTPSRPFWRRCNVLLEPPSVPDTTPRVKHLWRGLRFICINPVYVNQLLHTGYLDRTYMTWVISCELFWYTQMILQLDFGKKQICPLIQNPQFVMLYFDFISFFLSLLLLLILSRAIIIISSSNITIMTLCIS